VDTYRKKGQKFVALGWHGQFCNNTFISATKQTSLLEFVSDVEQIT
jgi:hypothetical protein